MRFNNLKITQRLALGFGAVLLLLCALTGVALSGLNAARDAQTNLKAMDQRSALADEWVSHTRLNINRVMAMAKSGNDPQVDAHFKPLIAQTTDRINGLQKALEDSVDSEQGKNLLGAVGERRKQYIAVRKSYFAALAAADPQAEDLLQTGLIPAVESYIGSMEKLQQHERELVELADQAAGQAVSQGAGAGQDAQHAGRRLDWAPGQFLKSRDGHLVCAVHGAAFELQGGNCVSGPCKGDALRAVPVRVEDGRVLLG